jgi:hypothetical protein
VWRRRWTILFWAVLFYLVILAVILAVGSIHDALVDPKPTIIREGPGTPPD